MSFPFAWILWDPSRIIFTVPLLNFPIRWYSLCFATGFVIGYFLLINLLKEKILQLPGHASNEKQAKKLSHQLIDRLTWYILAGTILGARLGHVLFYEPWATLWNDPLMIIRLENGGFAGLASHGGAIGIIIAVFFFYRHLKKKLPAVSLLEFMDIFCVPVPMAGAFIRFGNFFNQEIVGTPSDLPWAVLFAHPLEGGAIVPRHPVQLYEAAAYLLTFVVLLSLWRFQIARHRPGIITAWTFILIFGSRLALEFFKVNQGGLIAGGFLQTGQVLSIPFIIAGVALLFTSKRSTLSKA